MKSGRAPAIGSTGPLPALSTVAAALLVVGCASAPGDGGARGAEPVSPVPDRVSDGDASSTATPEGSPSADVNRRILEAAARDPATATDGAPENHENYRIGPGDRLETNVFGVEEFSGTFLVGQGGEIAVPLLGPVPAAGRTPRQLEGLLEDRLRATYMKDPHVTVQVVEMQSHGVSVIG
ncbi:MAG TPA: polysaccharide biosynthesis/export family protein, partial [Longimicrobiales bacterium]|nr:polysaccharide biosynthesis/export family protein [Longimicrobiales bacterium]